MPRFRLADLVDFDSFSLDRSLAERLEEYGVEVELDPLAQSIDISTRLNSVRIDANPYDNTAYVYTDWGVFKCRDLGGLTIVVEGDALSVVGYCDRVV